MDDPCNYDKWNYLRTNANRYYTKFIIMRMNSYQNDENELKSCGDMQKAFVKNGYTITAKGL